MAQPPHPVIPQGGQAFRHGSHIEDHVRHPEHVAKEDRSRFGDAGYKALRLAVEARKVDDTDDAIVARATAFRSFLLKTSSQ